MMRGDLRKAMQGEMAFADRAGARLRRRLLAGLVLVVAVVAVSAMGALASGAAPTAETEHVSSLGRTSVVLNANVNPNGSAVTECYFEYGTSEGALSSRADCSYLPGESETPIPVLATVEGLPETTSYFFRIHAKSAEGESSGTIRQFTTLPTAPVANTEPSSPVGRTSATLNAFITPDDAEVTECYFEYGTSPTEMSTHVPCSPTPGEESTPVAVHASISGLSESTTYYVRVVAHNSFGTEHGGRGNFETLPAAPRANTEPAVAVEHTSATLRGFVTPNGAPIEACYFEWGHAIEEHTTPCEQTEIGSGEAPVAVTAHLTGLPEGQSYRFRLVAINPRGTGTGGGVGFSTLPFVPKTLIMRPDEMADTSALLRAKINPQDEAITECTFEYGTTPALGKKASCSSLPGAGEKYVQVSALVGGLTPTTAYLVRIRAADVSGVTYSKTESFTTFEPGLLPVVSKLKPRKGASNGGTIVTIKGQNLLGATSVSFGETTTSAITADSADSLTVVSPPGVGIVDVIVTTASGESKTSSGDQFTYGQPVITGVSPNHGSTMGGTEVTVTGYGFEPGNTGTTFQFSKQAATAVECNSSSTCTMIAPASFKGKQGTVNIQAKVKGKGSKKAPDATFTYEA